MIFVTAAAGHVGRAVVCRLASLGHDEERDDEESGIVPILKNHKAKA